MFITMALGLAFLLWRAKYGFCYNDEPFIVTLAQRLYNGDALIVDEWHGTQLFSAVLLPFYAAFRLFSSTNEGILLVFRYTYCVLWWITCSALCLRLSKRYKSAPLVFIYLILFSPLDYMTLSYTSIGLMCALVISYILYHISLDEKRPKVVVKIAFSVCWVVLVLSSPFMAIVYIGLLLMAIIGAYIEKKKESGFFFHNLLHMYKLSIIIAGITAIAYVVLFIISRADISTVIENIPYVLSDPEHESISFFGSLIKTIEEFYLKYPAYIIVSMVIIACGFIFKSKLNIIRILLFTVSGAMFVYGQYLYLQSDMLDFNFQMAYVVILGAVAFSLLNRKNYALFFSFYGFSIAYTLLNGVVSNTGIMATSMTLTVAGVAGIIFIVEFMKELVEQYKSLPILRIVSIVIVCAMLLVQGSSELYVRLHRQYWDASLPELTYKIRSGAAKGLMTTSQQVFNYEMLNQNLTYLLRLADTEDKTFMSCTSAPYVYLNADMDFATFSAWTFGYGANLNDRVLQYQYEDTDHVPDIVFCGSQNDILPFIDDTYIQYNYGGSYLFVKK